jgi:hypothetical protein
MYYDAPVLIGRSQVQSGPRKTLIKSGYDGESDEFLKADMDLAGQVAEILLSYYPGYLWKCRASSKGGIITIQLPPLIDDPHKFVLHMRKINGWPDLVKKCIWAGGEMLERFKVPRSSINLAAFMDARKWRVYRFNQKPPE